MTSRRRFLRLVGDGAAAVVALWAAFQVRLHVPIPGTRGLLPGDRLRFLSREWLVVLLLQLSTLYFLGLYDAAPRPRGPAGRAPPPARAAGGSAPAGWPSPPRSRPWPSWPGGSWPTASSPARWCCCSWSSI